MTVPDTATLESVPRQAATNLLAVAALPQKRARCGAHCEHLLDKRRSATLCKGASALQPGELCRTHQHVRRHPLLNRSPATPLRANRNLTYCAAEVANSSILSIKSGPPVLEVQAGTQPTDAPSRAPPLRPRSGAGSPLHTTSQYQDTKGRTSSLLIKSEDTGSTALRRTSERVLHIRLFLSQWECRSLTECLAHEQASAANAFAEAQHSRALAGCWMHFVPATTAQCGQMVRL